MSSSELAEILKGLIQISNQMDVEKVEIDENDDSISLKVGKKRFLIEIKEV